MGMFATGFWFGLGAYLAYALGQVVIELMSRIVK